VLGLDVGEGAIARRDAGDVGHGWQDRRVPPDVLVHLAEPADWRAALADGALRPPSLSSAGFLHLSTPQQVHLPAAALFPGRRDLVLLVVDPARLPAPLRWEPGRPDDPPGMLFPHLYGPLPVTAVVAVVPWRPPDEPVLPLPGDALGRALALQLSVPVRRAAEVVDVPGGVAVLDPTLRHSRDDNRLLLSQEVDAAAIEEATRTVAALAGWPALSATLRWPGAGGVVRQLASRGWEVDELLLMGRPPGAGTGGERAEIVDQREVHRLWDSSWRQLLAAHFPESLDAVAGQLVGREARNDRVVAVTDVVIREDGVVRAAGQLRVDGATAAVDSVLTEPAARGRGHADAVLGRILGLAADAGCDLVVLEAAAADWPRHWYARRGFAVLGSTWDVVRPAVQAGTSTDSSR
jgi:uncharacterized protein (DUF952 family)/GNAT superfamily N-acetyltransferase